MLLLFAVHNAHETVRVMVSDYALDVKHQFWPDKNYSQGYKGKNISYCSVVPHPPPSSPRAAERCQPPATRLCKRKREGLQWTEFKQNFVVLFKTVIRGTGLMMMDQWVF